MAGSKTNIRVLPRNQGEARRVAKAAYPYCCCIVCGMQNATTVMIAHLDHNAGNNAPDNLAYLCQTHHWMYDCGLFPIKAIKLLRAHWQLTLGKPSHAARMKDAGKKAAATRKRRSMARKRTASAKKAWKTRRGIAARRRPRPGRVPL